MDLVDTTAGGLLDFGFDDTVTGRADNPFGSFFPVSEETPGSSPFDTGNGFAESGGGGTPNVFPINEDGTRVGGPVVAPINEDGTPADGGPVYDEQFGPPPPPPNVAPINEDGTPVREPTVTPINEDGTPVTPPEEGGEPEDGPDDGEGEGDSGASIPNPVDDTSPSGGSIFTALDRGDGRPAGFDDGGFLGAGGFVDILDRGGDSTPISFEVDNGSFGDIDLSSVFGRDGTTTTPTLFDIDLDVSGDIPDFGAPGSPITSIDLDAFESIDIGGLDFDGLV